MFTSEVDHEGNDCLKYTGIIGGVDGSCKRNQGGLTGAKRFPTTILIYNESAAFNVNLFEILNEHRKLCNKNKNKDDL